MDGASIEPYLQDLDPALLLLVGAFLPALQSAITSVKWPPSTEALVAFVTAMVVGVLVAWLQDAFYREGIIASCAAVYSISQLMFFGVYRPTGAARAIEQKVLPRE